jgi:hypothetical protein
MILLVKSLIISDIMLTQSPWNGCEINHIAISVELAAIAVRDHKPPAVHHFDSTGNQKKITISAFIDTPLEISFGREL